MPKNQKVEQSITGNNGDVVAPILSGVKVEGDLIIGKSINTDSLKDKGFDLEIKPTEELLIKFGRYLLNKLGLKKFIVTVILGILIPSGSTIYLYSTSMRDLNLISANLYAILASIVVLAVFLVLGGEFVNSKCKFCNKFFATIPIKRKITGKIKYRGEEHYRINEVRRCDFCGKITNLTYTESHEKNQEKNDFNLGI